MLIERKKFNDDLTIEYHYDEGPENPFKAFDTGGKYFLPATRNYIGIDTGGFGDLDTAMEAAKVCADNGGPIAKLSRWNGRIQVVFKGDIQKVEGEDGEAFWEMDGERVEEYEGVCFVENGESAEILKADIKAYNYWADGEVYGYVIKNAMGEEVDSCWGFYGWEDVEQEAEAAASVCDPYLVRVIQFGDVEIRLYKYQGRYAQNAGENLRRGHGRMYNDTVRADIAANVFGIVDVSGKKYPVLLGNCPVEKDFSDDRFKSFFHTYMTDMETEEVFALLNADESWQFSCKDDLGKVYVSPYYPTETATIVAALKHAK